MYYFREKQRLDEDKAEKRRKEQGKKERQKQEEKRQAQKIITDRQIEMKKRQYYR
jgi:hypothetical protein